MMSLIEYEIIASKLLSGKKQKNIDHEILGEAIAGIATADHKHDITKGHLGYYRKLYFKYYMGMLFRKRRRINKKETCFSVFCPRDESKIQITFGSKSDVDHSSSEMLEYIKSLSVLSDRDKRIIEDRFWGKLKLHEIAAKEDVSTQWIEKLIKRALEKLKDVVI